MKEQKGPYETKFLEHLYFSEAGPILQLEQGRELQLKKLRGNIYHDTRSSQSQSQVDGTEEEVNTGLRLIRWIKYYKRKAYKHLEKELTDCMNKESLANAFRCLNILSLPAVTEDSECYENSYREEDIEVLGQHFGKKHWVIKSFKDCTSTKGLW